MACGRRLRDQFKESYEITDSRAQRSGIACKPTADLESSHRVSTQFTNQGPDTTVLVTEFLNQRTQGGTTTTADRARKR